MWAIFWLFIEILMFHILELQITLVSFIYRFLWYLPQVGNQCFRINSHNSLTRKKHKPSFLCDALWPTFELSLSLDWGSNKFHFVMSTQDIFGVSGSLSIYLGIYYHLSCYLFQPTVHVYYIFAFVTLSLFDNFCKMMSQVLELLLI